jgi:two-component system nitrogen regulation response regulator GlnG
MEVLRRGRALDEHLQVIMITAYGGICGAVEAMKAGAYHYLAKPFDHAEVVRIVRQALTERNLKLRPKISSNETPDVGWLREVMGPSDAVSRIISAVNQVAKSNFSVVILGETGSGKELVARAIHNSSPRSGAPFVAVDCGAIPETLLESELFGYEKGAFTGAERQKPGKFEAAQGGTLFLDEISNLALGSQAKLLRVLQEKRLYRLGGGRGIGDKTISVDVRLLAASNQDIEASVASGSFRHDIFFRLSEFTITIPPLRERKEDILYLAKRFLDSTTAELKKSVTALSTSAVEVLLAYNWPGNVRELRSTIRRAVLLADEVITEEHLDITMRMPPFHSTFIAKVNGRSWRDLSLKEIVRRCTTAIEREVLLDVLRETRGNKAKAARLLQVDYKTIHSKVRVYGLP